LRNHANAFDFTNVVIRFILVLLPTNSIFGSRPTSIKTAKSFEKVIMIILRMVKVGWFPFMNMWQTKII